MNHRGYKIPFPNILIHIMKKNLASRLSGVLTMLPTPGNALTASGSLG
jgi:hypothetical protein